MLHVCVWFAVVRVPCSLVVTCWEKADLLAVVFFEFCHFPKSVLVHNRLKGEDGAPLNRFKPSSKIFYWMFQDGISFVILLCFSSVLCLLCLCMRLFICALWSPAGKGLVSWLSFVVSNCKLITFPLVSWVRCGTWVYQLLIFAPLLTFNSRMTFKAQLKVGCWPKNYIECYIPKCLSDPEVYEPARIQWSLLVRA